MPNFRVQQGSTDPDKWRTITADTMQEAAVRTIHGGETYPLTVWVVPPDSPNHPNGAPFLVHKLTLTLARRCAATSAE